MQYPYNNYNYGYNPVMQNTSQLIRVTGIDGAKAYQMQPNSVVPLFDINEDVMYIKSTDGANFPTIKTFAFTAVENAPLQTSNDYVTRAEFEKMKQEVLDNVKQFVSSNTDESASDR